MFSTKMSEGPKAGEDDGIRLPGKPPESKEDMDPALKAYMDELDAYLDKNRHVFESLSRQLGFGIRFGEKTAFDHKNNNVIIGVMQLYEWGIKSEAVIDFLVSHELGHFKELTDDPEGYMSVIAEGDRDDNLGGAYFRFYNCLMDIYVNTNTRNKAPVYSRLDGSAYFSEEIESLYRDILFNSQGSGLFEVKGSELRPAATEPLSTQYSDYLLNLGMGTEDCITLSPEVKAIVDAPLKLYGKEYTHRELINTFLRPAIGLRKTKLWQATISQRKTIIDQTLRPNFEKLINIDVARGANPNPSDSLGDFEVSPDDLKKAAEVTIDRKTEANRSDKEKQEDERKDQAKNIGRNNGLSEAEAKNFAEKLSKMQPFINDVVKLLQMCRFKTSEWVKQEQGHYRTGVSLDIVKAISEFSKIQNAPWQARVMKREFYQQEQDLHPKMIRLWLVPDFSGSMADDLSFLQDLTIGFAGALATLSTSKELGQSDLGGALAIIGFHGDAVEAVKMTDGVTLADIAKGWGNVKADGSSTSDHVALEEVLKQVKDLPDEEDAINLVVEITDGATSDPGESLKAVKALREHAVTPFAYRIARGGFEGGKAAFNSIWNSEGHSDGVTVKNAAEVLVDIRQRLARFVLDR